MPQAIGKFRWTICALLFFATTVNYLDRQVLSLLQPKLEDLFGWSNTDYANITAVFQFTYAIFMLYAGRIIDRLGTRWGYGLAIVVWSLGAIVHAFAIPIGNGLASLLGWVGIGTFSVSVTGFMLSRGVLALGEAGNFPAAIKATAEYFPKKERSLATGLFNSGANVGAILAPLTVPWIGDHWGWEWAFIIIGLIGFIWLGLWLMIYERPEKQKRMGSAELAYIHSDEEDRFNFEKHQIDSRVVDQPSPPGHTLEMARTEDSINTVGSKVSWSRLFTYRQTWAFTFGKFMTDGVWWFFLFWLPAYLKAQYGIVGSGVSLPLFVLYTMAMVGSITGGWFPMWFMRRGHQPYDGRMKAMLVIALFPLVVLAAQPLGDISYWIPVLLIGVGASAHQAWSANIFTTVSDMFPKKAIGSVIGIGGMAGGLGGVVMSKLGGALFDHYKGLGHISTGYTIMFTICALAYIVAWIIMKMLVPVYKPITDL